MKQTMTNFFDTCYKQSASNANFTKLGSIFGYKVTANKVLNTVLLKNITTLQTVEVVSSTTALDTLYIGGSSNIDGVIVNIAISYVGSNNFPLLDTKGNFGSRLNNVSAASRYIKTKKSENFDKVFNKDDLNILPRYNFEGQDIEYKFLTFSVPLLLINGSEGMGSGHAQKILPRSLNNCVEYIKCYLAGKPLPELPVHYNGFLGTIDKGLENQWIIRGAIKRVSAIKIQITEMPIGENYKSAIKKLNALVESGVVKKYDDLCDPKNDKFNFFVYGEFGKLTDAQIITKLKLETTITENFTFIDENNAVTVYNSPEQVMNHYIRIKLEYLQKRKDYLIESLAKDIELDESKSKFIEGIINDTLIINKRKKKDIEADLDKIDDIVKKDSSYDYLLNMSISSLTEERLDKLYKDIKAQKEQLAKTEKTTISAMWIKDLSLLGDLGVEEVKIVQEEKPKRASKKAVVGGLDDWD